MLHRLTFISWRRNADTNLKPSLNINDLHYRNLDFVPIRKASVSNTYTHKRLFIFMLEVDLLFEVIQMMSGLLQTQQSGGGRPVRDEQSDSQTGSRICCFSTQL